MHSVWTWKAAFFPELFPHPYLVARLNRIAELVSKHADLPAMMHVVHDHVSEHRSATRPATRPAIAVEVRDATFAGESVSEHLGTALGTLCEGSFHLARRAARAIEFGGQLDVRR